MTRMGTVNDDRIIIMYGEYLVSVASTVFEIAKQHLNNVA